ncbi:MAG TPA: tellurite resistance/C4-dicarboxylate transporter family protein [Verrucomicrobiae bacterium]|nr:tellurite resistance/C4-dicarboxylate transporter family protein [Verrucomicrobiae bacterium]
MIRPEETSNFAPRENTLPREEGLAGFFPGYFALVMATGIVSLAMHHHGIERISKVLFWFNAAAYIFLWMVTLARFAFYRKLFLFDLTHHSRAATFLTTIAATCVLGAQFAILTPGISVAKALWCFGVLLWIVLSYTFFTVITVREPKPPLEAGINGAWLLAIVATESISVLGTLVAPFFRNSDPVLFIALAAYLVGAMLYVFFATLILYRWMFFRMQPEKLTPDYWIDMGALAITTLAGAHLLRASPQWSLLQNLAPFLTGFTLFFWATGTWWIPLLLIVELWRHIFGRVPLVYGPDYWSFVFPLGMYSAATFLLIRVTGLTFLKPLAILFVYIAMIAWLLTFAGMLHSLARSSLKKFAFRKKSFR